MLNIYLSGEIHTDWREEIINLCKKENLWLTATYYDIQRPTTAYYGELRRVATYYDVLQRTAA